MKRFVAYCDCGFTKTYPTERGASGSLRRHECPSRFVAELAQPHDTATVEGRMEAYRPLAAKLAGFMARRHHLRYDDVYADALVGLWEAATRWTEDGGASFPTFATTRIKGEIIDAQRRENGRGANLWRKGGSVGEVSLDRLIDDDQTAALVDTLPDPHDSLTAWWDDMERAEAAAAAERIIAELVDSAFENSRSPERNREMIRAHIAGRTFADIADDHGMTESNVCQVWRRWLRSLTPDAADGSLFLRFTA